MANSAVRHIMASALCLLCACASTGPKTGYFLKDREGHYYADDRDRILRVESDGTVLDLTGIPLELAQNKARADIPAGLAPSGHIRVLGTARKTAEAWDMSPFGVTPQNGGCAPMFQLPSIDDTPIRRRSCWNRLWEVPTAIVFYPVAAVVMIGAATSPIWLPILLFR